MLAAAGQGLIDTLKAYRHIADKIRTVERLPELGIEELLQRYVADAPAYYVLPGRFRGVGDDLVFTFTIAGVVRNVGGHDLALAGDGLDIGADHLLHFAARALHAHRIAGCSWKLVRGEMVDDPIFDKAGVAAIEMEFESSPVPIDADWELGELESFQHFHADVDLKPFAGEAEYQSWLAEPPVYTNSRPDATVDLPLEGA